MEATPEGRFGYIVAWGGRGVKKIVEPSDGDCATHQRYTAGVW
jgi:hypothetical protein